MAREPSLLAALILIALLAGCGPGGSQVERASQTQAERRVAEALQQTHEEARHERNRREFWQATAFGSALAAVVLLVVGVALGSRSKPHEPASYT